MTKAVFFLSAILAGCSSLQQSHHSSLTDSSDGQNFDQRAQQAKVRSDREQEARDKKLILAKQNQLGSSPTSYPQTLSKAPAMTRASAPGKLLEVTPESVIASNFQQMPEGQLYAEVMDRYQAHDSWGFELRSKAYLAKFTNSERRDEIIYLKGLTELSDKNYGVALAQFNRVLRDHPNGKKAPSAMFAKGITYRRMNLNREAKLALSEVLHRFPGSPESMRAKAELKIIK